MPTWFFFIKLIKKSKFNLTILPPPPHVTHLRTPLLSICLYTYSFERHTGYLSSVKALTKTHNNINRESIQVPNMRCVIYLIFSPFRRSLINYVEVTTTKVGFGQGYDCQKISRSKIKNIFPLENIDGCT